MGSHLNGEHLIRDFVLRKTFPPKKDCGMTVSRSKLGWSQRVAEMEVTVTMP
jgi:hypothetical protein